MLLNLLAHLEWPSLFKTVIVAKYSRGGDTEVRSAVLLRLVFIEASSKSLMRGLPALFEGVSS